MTLVHSEVPILGFAAFSGTGKTTLLTAVLPLLKQRGYRIAVIKHAHHQFDIDHPGKDSYELRKAGADQMLIASRKRWALMVENEDNDKSPSLQTLLNHLDADAMDIILVEGFKAEAFPKIELHRNSVKRDFLYTEDSNIIAVASDEPVDLPSHITALDINNPHQITEFIITNIIKKTEGNINE